MEPLRGEAQLCRLEVRQMSQRARSRRRATGGLVAEAGATGSIGARQTKKDTGIAMAWKSPAPRIIRQWLRELLIWARAEAHFIRWLQTCGIASLGTAGNIWY
ncbi:hypothetical protein NDU88_002753 [Pleurodeles waltl]|uniref:Uncharacterized protein n=1 Tax=Pleurodeles waltl TaxID=8319 RepID=A0AAV7TLK0_PLEWA|nr:hypothetical protein NDU88_002753 [Pleurodeles waltl]